MPYFGGSLTPFYIDFKVVAEICGDLLRFLQCSHDPGCSYPQPLIIWSTMPRVGAQPPKRSGPLPCEDMPREDGQTISLHFFILFPMPPNANSGLSMGHFGIAWGLLVWFPSAAPAKKVGLNLSTHHEIGDGASICNPFALVDFASNASKCQSWPSNGPFWNSVGDLYDFQVPPLLNVWPQPMKLVIEPAPAILLGWNCLESWSSTQSPISYWVGGLTLVTLWWLDLGNCASSPH